MYSKTNKGFTLIELLVVISIIGLLSSVILASLNTARSKARDAYRIASLQEIAKALAYYYDVNNHYPITNSGGWVWGCDHPAGNWIDDAGNLNWSSLYLKTQSHEPQPECPPGPNFFDNTDTSPSVDFLYYGGDGPAGFPAGSFYMLATRLENANDRNTIKNAKTTSVNGISFFPGWPERTYVLVGR